MPTVSTVVPIEYGTFRHLDATIAVQGSRGLSAQDTLWLVHRQPGEAETSLGAVRGLITGTYTLSLNLLHPHLRPYQGDLIREAVRVYEDWADRR